MALSSWVIYSSCSGPTWHESEELERKRICKEQCAVRLDCLAYALMNNIDTEIWGGLTPSQRVMLTTFVPSLVSEEAVVLSLHRMYAK